MAKSNYLKVTSPKGEAFYPYLKSPEMYEGDPVGYTIQVKYSKKDTEALMAAIEAELERAKGDPAFKGKTWMKEPAMGCREKPDGSIMFKFKTKHEYERDGEIIKRKVPIFDAKGKPTDVNLGNGSIVKIAFQVVPFWKSARNNGVTLYLDAVQVLELKEYSGGSGSAGAFGFGEEEGFEADDNGAGRFYEPEVSGEDAGGGEF